MVVVAGLVMGWGVVVHKGLILNLLRLLHLPRLLLLRRHHRQPRIIMFPDRGWRRSNPMMGRLMMRDGCPKSLLLGSIVFDLLFFFFWSLGLTFSCLCRMGVDESINALIYL